MQQVIITLETLQPGQVRQLLEEAIYRAAISEPEVVEMLRRESIPQGELFNALVTLAVDEWMKGGSDGNDPSQ